MREFLQSANPMNTVVNLDKVWGFDIFQNYIRFEMFQHTENWSYPLDSEGNFLDGAREQFKQDAACLRGMCKDTKLSSEIRFGLPINFPKQSDFVSPDNDKGHHSGYEE